MTAPPAPSDCSPAEVLGRYRLGERIAAGSLGTVVAAIDLRTGREVAVKFFDGARDNYAAWVDEMRLALRLAHPHVVPCLDAGHDERWGLSVLVFPRALGGSLRRALAGGRRFAPAEVQRLLAEMAAALTHAHALGVVHRDLKPENILAMAAPGAPPWGLTDFGAGRFLARGATMRTLAGSLPYMAPELLCAGADARSDLYSLGVVGLELLAGERPELPARSEFRLERRAGGDLSAIVATLLDPDPDRRMFSAEALAAALAAVHGGLDLGRLGDGTDLLLAGDEVSRLRPGAARLERVARVPRALRFVHDAGEDAAIVASDRRVVGLAGGTTTLLASDRPFATFVASRRDAAIWLLRADELGCSDLAGQLQRLRVELPAAWPTALARGAPPTGAVLAPGLAALGVLGCRELIVARRGPQGLRAGLLRASGPLYSLVRRGAQVVALCGDATATALLEVGADGLTRIDERAQAVDTVAVIAGPRGARLASLVNRGHEDQGGGDSHG